MVACDPDACQRKRSRHPARSVPKGVTATTPDAMLLLLTALATARRECQRQG